MKSTTGEPPYQRIAAELRRRIERGELRPGERVPSTRQLAREWGVALATAAHALRQLAKERLVRSLPRAGTVVASPSPRLAAPAGTNPRGIGLFRHAGAACAVEHGGTQPHDPP